MFILNLLLGFSVCRLLFNSQLLLLSVFPFLERSVEGYSDISLSTVTDEVHNGGEGGKEDLQYGGNLAFQEFYKRVRIIWTSRWGVDEVDPSHLRIWRYKKGLGIQNGLRYLDAGIYRAYIFLLKCEVMTCTD